MESWGRNHCVAHSDDPSRYLTLLECYLKPKKSTIDLQSWSILAIILNAWGNAHRALPFPPLEKASLFAQILCEHFFAFLDNNFPTGRVERQKGKSTLRFRFSAQKLFRNLKSRSKPLTLVNMKYPLSISVNQRILTLHHSSTKVNLFLIKT